MTLRNTLLVFLAVAASAFAPAAESGGIELQDMAVQGIPSSSFEPAWTPMFAGIDGVHISQTEPVLLSVYAVRIDLRATGIGFYATPSNGDRPLETDGQKTSTFLKDSGCQLAINASPFTPVYLAEGHPRDILGLGVSNGEVYSNAHRKKAAMLITRDNRVSFSRPPFDTAKVYNAVGGFDFLLEAGKNVGGEDERHPRTAAGTSKDGRWLYFLLIDGRQEGYSVGATTAETGAWLGCLGAYEAINLDGGGSTCLAISDGQGGVQVLNRPIHQQIPGNERVNGNNLGVYAKPLGK